MTQHPHPDLIDLLKGRPLSETDHELAVWLVMRAVEECDRLKREALHCAMAKVYQKEGYDH